MAQRTAVQFIRLQRHGSREAISEFALPEPIDEAVDITAVKPPDQSSRQAERS